MLQLLYGRTKTQRSAVPVDQHSGPAGCEQDGISDKIYLMKVENEFRHSAKCIKCVRRVYS